MPTENTQPMTRHEEPAPSFTCRICGSSSLTLFFTQGNDGEFHFYRCRNCKLVNYDLSGGLDQGKYEQKYEDPLDDSNRFNHPQTATFKFLNAHLPPQGKLLEIGCGNGRLLHLSHQAGWSVSGLELSSFMAQSVTERLNLPVLVSNIDAPDLADRLTEKPYDLILLRHVLEHLPEPLSVMKLLHSLLADRGHVLMEFPNIDGVDLKFKRLTRKLGLSHKKYPPDYHPGHCNEYCREAYQALIDRTGFELIAWETYSMKPTQNLLFNRWHIGNKARALIRKK